jgi:predicted DNA-binding transcriptional regulator YafY
LAAPEKLYALLEIVRLTVTRQGVTVSELSETLSLSEKKVREAVLLLSVIGIPPYRPDQLLDIFIDDDDMVYCDLDQGLAIEPRLSVEECEALALALQWVSPHSRQIMDDLLKALPREINANVQAMLKGFGQSLAEEEITSVEAIQDAIERKNGIRLFYYSASRQTEDHYELVPWKLLHFDTGRYLWAGMAGEEQGRLFRLDRIRGVEKKQLSGDEYLAPLEPPKSAQPLAAHEAVLEIVVTTPALKDYLSRLGAYQREQCWVLPYASESWIFSRLRELTGKVRVVEPTSLMEDYRQWMIETIESYDSAGAD